MAKLKVKDHSCCASREADRIGLRITLQACEDFRAAMAAAGITWNGQIVADGKLHRFKAEGDHHRNSWYVLHAGPPAAGIFGCWKRDIKQTWCERNVSLSQADSQRIRQQWNEAKSKLEAETVARQKRARKLAAWILSRSRPARTLHRYLAHKCVKIFGDVCEYRGALALPLRDINGELHSLQFIGFDGLKKFLTGGCVAGCFFTVADKVDGPLVICEGYGTGATAHEATGYSVICAMNCGNLLEVAKAARELWPQREIIVAADNDQFTEGNPGLTKATAAAKAIHAKLAVPRFQDAAGKRTDFNDLAASEGLDAVREQIGAAQIAAETDAEAFARLAALPPAEYDRCRQTEAVALGIRVTTLDSEVEHRRRWTGGNDSTLQGCAVDLPEIEPWPDPVDGAEVLDAISKRHRAYVALPDYAADVCALWEAHCHFFEAFDITPRLCVTSPEKGCGKTTLLDVIALFVPRPLRSENLTAAVLFRVIEARKPTVLADEYDSWLKDNEELRGLFNAGHRRGGQVLRCEGDKHEVRAFQVFGPAVLCGIGALPGTLHDRSIKIPLERAKPGEIHERLDSRHIDSERELCRKLARWCSNNRPALESCDPTMPDGAFNRLADNWRSLFAIAEIAGGDWPKRAREAFAKLTSTEDLDAQSVGTQLLGDISAAFTAKNTDKIFSAQLCEELAAIEGRPWAEWGRQRKRISMNQLATQLRRFSVSPHEIRIGEETGRGYELADFKDAFSRYLADTPVSDRNSETLRGKTVIPEVKHTENMFHPENGPLQRECFTVSPQKGDTSENSDSSERDVEAVSADVDAFLPDLERSAEKEKLRL
jgi:putative DNA primase/helicase